MAIAGKGIRYKAIDTFHARLHFPTSKTQCSFFRRPLLRPREEARRILHSSANRVVVQMRYPIANLRYRIRSNGPVHESPVGGYPPLRILSTFPQSNTKLIMPEVNALTHEQWDDIITVALAMREQQSSKKRAQEVIEVDDAFDDDAEF
ncbi:hypothetical protein D9615_000906 [Tricholomella constricta]|uniref:Uncharacterized protein n=1 Tax=Tricholomella constricta TaxID=117010 RepID=A0A8H5HK99_9AGAR|nr:hypothetical protein D9615_000906 [Tricholomella constricta]